MDKHFIAEGHQPNVTVAFRRSRASFSKGFILPNGS
jgi:hypothetical protein